MNTMLLRVLLMSATVLLAGCSVQTQNVQANPPQTCEARGGTIKPVGRAQTLQCVLNFSDAGKVCTDSGQCQGDCLGETHTATTGRCAPTSDRFGCRTVIINGAAEPTICID